MEGFAVRPRLTSPWKERTRMYCLFENVAGLSLHGALHAFEGLHAMWETGTKYQPGSMSMYTYAGIGIGPPGTLRPVFGMPVLAPKSLFQNPECQITISDQICEIL